MAARADHDSDRRRPSRHRRRSLAAGLPARSSGPRVDPALGGHAQERPSSGARSSSVATRGELAGGIAMLKPEAGITSTCRYRHARRSASRSCSAGELESELDRLVRRLRNHRLRSAIFHGVLLRPSDMSRVPIRGCSARSGPQALNAAEPRRSFRSRDTVRPRRRLPRRRRRPARGRRTRRGGQASRPRRGSNGGPASTSSWRGFRSRPSVAP